MKYFGLGLMMAAVTVAPVFAEDAASQTDFKKAANAAGDMGFNISLAQTARLLDYCDQKTKAKEVRDYLQPVTMAVAQQKFNDAAQGNARGMYLSRTIAASMSSEVATIALLMQLEPLSEAQKAKICGVASDGYTKVMELKSRSLSGSTGDSKAGVTQGAAVPAK